jgi:hypothetical protein
MGLPEGSITQITEPPREGVFRGKKRGLIRGGMGIVHP